MEDDFDGSPAAQTIHFGWKGTDYVIDLSDDNAAEFTEMMTPWLDAARRAGAKPRGGGGRRRATPASGSANSSVDPAAVRAWAREQGMKISDRGRVRGEIIEAYLAAH